MRACACVSVRLSYFRVAEFALEDLLVDLKGIVATVYFTESHRVVMVAFTIALGRSIGSRVQT